MIDPLALSEFFGGDLRPYDLEDWDQQDYERIRAERDAAGNGLRSKASAKQVAYIEKLHAMGCLGDDVLEAAAAMTVADADAAIKAGETVFTRRRQYAAIKTAAGRERAACTTPRWPGCRSRRPLARATGRCSGWLVWDGTAAFRNRRSSAT